MRSKTNLKHSPGSLHAVPLFQSLPENEITRLEASRAPLEIPPGQVILEEGQADDFLFVILQGRVEVVKSMGRDQERILGIREDGGLLGEMSLFSGENRHIASVRALTAVRLLQVTRDDLNGLLQRQPQFAYDIIRLLSQRLEESENQIIRDLKDKNRALQKAYDDLKAAQAGLVEKEKLEKELQIAREIQESILPENLPERQGYDFGARMVPARAVGGDFFTFIELPGDRLGIVVADVSDKGVPAALFMALTYSLVHAEAGRTDSPAEVLRNVNAELLQMNASGMFVTLLYGILDPGSGRFRYARAAHPVPFLVNGAGSVVEQPAGRVPPLGLFDDLAVDENTLTLEAGGTLLLYSDGISEPMDANGNEFGTESIGFVINRSQDLPARGTCDRLWEAVQAHGQGQPQQDDFTVVVVKRMTNG